MDFNDTPEEAEYRAAARAWLDTNVPEHKAMPHDDDLAAARAWQARKAAAGYAQITWPKEWGGGGGTPIQSVIFGQEEARYPVQYGYFTIGLGMCVPTVMAFADDATKQRFVGPAVRGEEIWCQLFSEPAGGSDVDRQVEVVQAPYACPGRGGVDRPGDEDALVHGLESHPQLHRFALCHVHEPLAPLGRGGHLDVELPHLSGAVRDVTHREDERTAHMLSDHPAMLSVGGTAGAVSPRARRCRGSGRRDRGRTATRHHRGRPPDERASSIRGHVRDRAGGRPSRSRRGAG